MASEAIAGNNNNVVNEDNLDGLYKWREEK